MRVSCRAASDAGAVAARVASRWGADVPATPLVTAGMGMRVGMLSTASSPGRVMVVVMMIATTAIVTAPTRRWWSSRHVAHVALALLVDGDRGGRGDVRDADGRKPAASRGGTGAGAEVGDAGELLAAGVLAAAWVDLSGAEPGDVPSLLPSLGHGYLPLGLELGPAPGVLRFGPGLIRLPGPITTDGAEGGAMGAGPATGEMAPSCTGEGWKPPLA